MSAIVKDCAFKLNGALKSTNKQKISFLIDSTDSNIAAVIRQWDNSIHF